MTLEECLIHIDKYAKEHITGTRKSARLPYYNNYSNKKTNMTTPFQTGTKNEAIFSTNAPYNNPYQGTAPRWLFVCSAGLLRSPTGATLAAQRGVNARACGSNFSYALIPCSANLINWAHKIIFVNEENLFNLEDNYADMPGLLEQIAEKSVVLDIPDCYEFMHPELVKIFEQQLFNQYHFE